MTLEYTIGCCYAHDQCVYLLRITYALCAIFDQRQALYSSRLDDHYLFGNGAWYSDLRILVAEALGSWSIDILLIVQAALLLIQLLWSIPFVVKYGYFLEFSWRCFYFLPLYNCSCAYSVHGLCIYRTIIAYIMRLTCA